MQYGKYIVEGVNEVTRKHDRRAVNLTMGVEKAGSWKVLKLKEP